MTKNQKRNTFAPDADEVILFSLHCGDINDMNVVLKKNLSVPFVALNLHKKVILIVTYELVTKILLKFILDSDLKNFNVENYLKIMKRIVFILYYL